jgi:GTPase KRas protein
MTEYRLVVVGNSWVGKSALTFQLINNNFVDRYVPTEDDDFSHQKMVEIDQETCLLDIFDAPLTEEFRIIRDRLTREGQGFLCVFSITCRNSFDDIPYYREHILRAKEEDHVLPMVLVGNKCDLEHERKVTASEGADMAKSFGCKYIETSAKARTNVEACFFELVREIRKARAREENKGSKHPTQQCFLC